MSHGGYDVGIQDLNAQRAGVVNIRRDRRWLTSAYDVPVAELRQTVTVLLREAAENHGRITGIIEAGQLMMADFEWVNLKAERDARRPRRRTKPSVATQIAIAGALIGGGWGRR